MKRFTAVVCTALLAACSGGGKPQSAIPEACAILKEIDLAKIVGEPLTFISNVKREDENVHLSDCSSLTAASTTPVYILVRVQLNDKFLKPADEQRALQVESLKSLYADDLRTDPVAIGDAGLWVEPLRQLMAWHQGGHIMTIVTTKGDDTRALAEKTARAILARYP